MLQSGLSSVSPEAAAHVQAILRRWQGDGFRGDFPVELWSLEHIARPWASDDAVDQVLVSLFGDYRTPAGQPSRQDLSKP